MTVKLSPGLSWQLGDVAPEPVPPLLFELLREIERRGSLAAAAKQCRVSYRSAWNLMKSWQEKLGAPLTEPCQGRGATLAACGSKLLWAHDYAISQSAATLKSVEHKVREELAATLERASPRPLVIRASHCLSHQPLVMQLQEDHRLRADIHHGGSARCLEHLTAGDCDAAGFHLADGPMMAGFISHYLDFFQPADCRLIHALRRRQGLIVKRGNPLDIRGIRDLVRPGVRFVNRQANSGTRMLLDLVLRADELDSAGIRGYDNIEFTHSAVSALVAGDVVDVGLGLEAAAVAQDLDFIPVASEVYYYAVRRSAWRSPGIQALLRVLQSDHWRDVIAAMDGFDAADSGAVTDAEKLFTR